MSVYVTGDIHGDPRRLSTSVFPEQREMTRDDYVIILGDFGLVWSGDKEEAYWLKWLEKKPFTILFVDGNHENFDMLNTFPVVGFHGGKAHRIRDNIYHLMRGYVFDIDGRKFFAFGGARSHDIEDGILDPSAYGPEEFKDICRSWRRKNRMFRVKGISWWEDELPEEEEMVRGVTSLTEVGMEVDFVISHCAPQGIASLMGFTESDILTDYFEGLLSDGLTFKRWLFGHYHVNRQVLGKYICLYEQIIQIA